MKNIGEVLSKAKKTGKKPLDKGQSKKKGNDLAFWLKNK